MVPGMNHDARALAARYYASSARSLGDDLVALAANPAGVVVWLPALVALLKPVCSACPGQWEDLRHIPAAADAWYVHLLAGSLPLALRLGRGLQPLPLLCFRRGLRNPAPHIHAWRHFVHNPDTIERHTHHGIH